MREFSLLVKPASADCNLNCKYCFYLDKSSLYSEEPRHRMSDRVLEQLIRTYMATPQSTYSFGWQGGEPTLMGLEFFRKVVDFQKNYGRAGAIVGNGLQTNATLIDDRMAKLFGDYKFLLGCSLDGPSEIHDRYRQNIQGKSSHQDVIRGIEALKRKNVEFNILVLVSKANVYQAKKVYEYLVGKGFYYHQFIPCVEYNLKGELTDFSITGEEWGNFLCEIYDLWYPKDVNIVSIRHFDSILMQIVENISNVCTLGKNCCQYFVVEYNGDIYPCDFFVEKQYKLGNILENTWEEMLSSKLYKDFGAKKTQWNSACENCLYINYCNGDCLKHRIFANNTPQRLSGLCVGWKAFYQHSLGGFNRLAEKIGKHRREATIQKNIESRIHPTSVGRNVLCTCGSGRKYKKCCGK